METQTDTDRLLERWFAQSDYTASTEATYRPVLNELFGRAGDPLAVGERVVVDFVLLDADGRRRQVSGNSLRRYRTALAAFYRWAYEQELISIDLRPVLKALELPCRRVRLGRWLTDIEASQLIEACDTSPRGVRDRALLSTALLTGLRAAELVSLTWPYPVCRQGPQTGGSRCSRPGSPRPRGVVRPRGTMETGNVAGARPGVLCLLLHRGPSRFHQGVPVRLDGPGFDSPCSVRADLPGPPSGPGPRRTPRPSTLLRRVPRRPGGRHSDHSGRPPSRQLRHHRPALPDPEPDQSPTGCRSATAQRVCVTGPSGTSGP